MRWNNCDAVKQGSQRMSGAWLFAGTRVPVTALFENLGAGATINEFVAWFPGVTEAQVLNVLRHVRNSLSESASRA